MVWIHLDFSALHGGDLITLLSDGWVLSYTGAPLLTSVRRVRRVSHRKSGIDRLYVHLILRCSLLTFSTSHFNILPSSFPTHYIYGGPGSHWKKYFYVFKKTRQAHRAKVEDFAITQHIVPTNSILPPSPHISVRVEVSMTCISRRGCENLKEELKDVHYVISLWQCTCIKELLLLHTRFKLSSSC